MALTKVTTGTIADDSIQSLKNRNLIINGAMNVAQRGTQVTGVTGNGYLTCDRWLVGNGNLGTWTVDQSTDAPNGFANSFKMTCTTADASPAAGDYCLLHQLIEAQNLQHLAFGTADAKSMTVSFWVKSNRTGSASFEIAQADNSSKTVSKPYTINSPNTWEYKTISIPADTAGKIDNDNGTGLILEWWLNSGSNYTGGSHATTWSTYEGSRRNPSNLGVGGAVNDYIAITGVQLELGDVATPFEHRSYGEELALCQRYCFVNSNSTANSVRWGQGMASSANNFFPRIQFPVPMRATPSFTYTTTGQVVCSDTAVARYITAMSLQGVTSNHMSCCLQATVGTGGLTQFRQYFVEGGTGLTKLFFEAEL